MMTLCHFNQSYSSKEACPFKNHEPLVKLINLKNQNGHGSQVVHMSKSYEFL